MLRLERLEINGFKSFPDKTHVEFPTGVTAVVGPNGCGKSNVVDAVQWALGEQSARALRGARMEDVIFAGSKDRGPGGMAEVTLHLVSSNGDAVFGEGRKRVSMTRRLYRSGESEYLLDGKKARLQDVRALLDEIRSGVRTYAIVDQSRVGSFVISKPKERRVFIEEAAGVAGYKQRRRLAELKLEATLANMLRISDIVREVERQRRSLQRQAALARRARTINDEYVALKSLFVARRFRELDRSVRDLSEWLAVTRSEASHLDEERRRVDSVLAEARRASDAAHGRREDALASRHEAALAIERLTREIESARERARALEEEAGRQEGESQRLALDREARHAEFEARKGDADALAMSLADVDRSLGDARAKAESARAEYREARDAATAGEQRLYDLLHQRAELQSRLSRAEEAAQREEKRAVEAEEAGVRLAEALELARGEQERAEAALAQAGEAADQRAGESSQAREAEDLAVRALDEARAAEAALAGQLGQLAGEKAALDSLEVRLAGAEGARAVLEMAREGRIDAEHVVADVLSADREIERAAEAFLAPLLSAVVVRNGDDVKRGATLGVRAKISFLPLDSPVHREGPRWRDLPEDLRDDARVRGRLADRIRVQGGLNGALASRVEDAVLVDDLATALELHHRFPSWSYLTPEGHAVHASGVVALEPASADGERDGLLARVRRRDELTAAVETLEERRRLSRETLEAARTALSVAQAKRRDADEALGEARRAVATARMTREQAMREVTRLDREVAKAKLVHEAAQKGAAEARERAAELSHSLGQEDERLATARQALEAARVHAHGREESFREATSALAHLESERRACEERHLAALREVERMRRSLDELDERGRRGSEARERALDEAGRLHERGRALLSDLERARAEESRLEALVVGLTEEGRACARRVIDVESHAAFVAEELEGARARREQAGLESERARGELEHLRQSCIEELGRPPEEVPATIPAGIDPEILASEAHLAARLAALRERRTRLGPVNLLAEQEFEELSARYTELSSQHDDLQQSVESLRSSITKMNRESKDRFLEAFHEIRRHFKEQFSTLFRGGKADLVLEDENDPLESGIEIYCQPPGKKLQTVSLLSGGEKALAATAVLFAIFCYHPPPFCLLDEVDAPLDDANVGRFAEAIRTFADRTQFVLVTHNKRTMELADLLYGVTMPEPGVSRLVSMTLD